jgi:Zn-finger nucleic acid-binding protein
VCPTCKGVLLDSNAIEQKFLDKTRIGIIKLLNESTEQSELQCSSCTDYMHVIKITYDDQTERVHNTGHSRGHRNILLDIVLEEVADVVEKALFGYSKMKIEGCKQCSSFWFD